METHQITAEIPNAYYDTFVKIFDGMGIKYRERNTKPRATVSKESETDGKEYVLRSILRGMEEVRLWKEGKLELNDAEELLNEL